MEYTRVFSLFHSGSLGVGVWLGSMFIKIGR